MYTVEPQVTVLEMDPHLFVSCSSDEKEISTYSAEEQIAWDKDPGMVEASLTPIIVDMP